MPFFVKQNKRRVIELASRPMPFWLKKKKKSICEKETHQTSVKFWSPLELGVNFILVCPVLPFEIFHNEKFFKAISTDRESRQGRVPSNLSTLVIVQELNWKGVGGERFFNIFLIYLVLCDHRKKSTARICGNLIYRHPWQQRMV